MDISEDTDVVVIDNEKIKHLYSMTKEIHKCLCTGLDGKPGIVERVRILETFRSGLNKILLTLGTITLANLIAIIFNFFKSAIFNDIAGK